MQNRWLYLTGGVVIGVLLTVVTGGFIMWGMHGWMQDGMMDTGWCRPGMGRHR